jgi:hypothetical protein
MHRLAASAAHRRGRHPGNALHKRRRRLGHSRKELAQALRTQRPDCLVALAVHEDVPHALPHDRLGVDEDGRDVMQHERDVCDGRYGQRRAHDEEEVRTRNIA